MTGEYEFRIASGASSDFLEQVAIIAGEPPWGSNLSPDERLHLICIFYSLRSLAQTADSRRLETELWAAGHALRKRGAKGRAADLMVQRAAWEYETNLVTLVDDIALWGDLERAGDST
jgi:hypothetical protein